MTRWIALISLVALAVLLTLAGAHLAGLGPFQQDDKPLMTVAISTAEPQLAEFPEPFAQVNPALIGALEAPELRPLDSVGGHVVPVGAWVPAAEDARLVLPTRTPYPTRTPTFTPIPTVTPEPTLTTTPVPSLTATITPTPWPTRPPVTHIIPTPTRSLENCAPAGMPLSGPLTQRFHYRHIGIDIGAPIGTPILTTQSGRVTYAGWSDRGYGNLVVIENGRFSTYYGHFDIVYVTVGQWVDSGAVLGLSGNTGNSTGPHLHYETRIDDIPVDPLTFEMRGYPHC